MTTQTYTSVVEHSSDATFRAWGLEFNTNLALVGLVQTADTGQINWTTVTRPGVNTAAGYEIWRFSDSSLYLKIEYGTGSATTVPQMWVTVGTGSNGSGTITGQTSTRNIWTAQSVISSTVTTYTTYLCHTTNALTVVWKVNASGGTTPLGFVVVGKTVDGSGAATTLGFGVLRYSSNTLVPSFQSVRIASTAVTLTDSTRFAVVVGDVTSSLVGADIQAYQIWMNVPNVVPFAWACIYLTSEITRLNTFSVAMVASASHTYLAIGSTGSINGQSSTNYSFAALYE